MESITIAQSIFLGIVQGLTEFLPISSSGHLNLIPWIFKWTENIKFMEEFEGSFDVALHIGTLLAIVLFFFKDWIELIKGGYNLAVKKEKSSNGKMFWYLVAATIPGGILGLLADKLLEDYVKTAYLLIAIVLIVMGIILYIADEKCKSKTTYENMNFKQTFLIGISQALAFIPGVSRSGITMTTGRLMGIDRESTAKYSFMLATPITVGAALYKLLSGAFTINLSFFIGILTSFIVGVIVIKFLLEYLKKGSFKIFAIYRIILGLVVIGIYFIR